MSRLQGRLRSVAFGALWHALAVALLLLGLTVALLGRPVWSGSSEALPAQLLLVGGYVASVLILAARSHFAGCVRFTDVVITVSSVFGLVFLSLLLPVFPHSRRLLLGTVASAGFLALIFFVFRRARKPAAVALAVAVALAATRSFGPTPAAKPRIVTESVPTAFLTLELTKHRGFIRQEKRGGGISRLGDRYVAATSDGRLYLFGWGADSLEIRELPHRVPLNAEAYAADGGDNPESFRVGDVLARTSGGETSVFASHHFWHADERCVTLRVSVLKGPYEALVAGDDSTSWTLLHEARPCLPVDLEHPFAGFNLGGRLALLSEDRLLVSVGDHGFDGWGVEEAVSQDTAVDYGKILQIDLDDLGVEIFSLGHRNPQGVYVDTAGRIWSTEHGPQGGDELNLIVRGSDYGWPKVTYGTHYGTYSWPPNDHPGEHRGFTRPTYAWVPSIGVSHLIGVEDSLFAAWRGDLLASSLGDRALWRLRLREGRVVYAERIGLDERIRDLVEGPGGTIVLWTDRGDILSLMPAGGESVFAACSGCHTIGNGRTHGIGPDLGGVFRRRIASAPDFAYSAALMELDGRWTADRLDRYLEDPASYAPGTSMQFEGVPDSLTRVLIIDHLMKRR